VPRNGGNVLRAVVLSQRDQRGAKGLAGPAGLWLLDAPPGIWWPGTEGPWVCQRGARAEPGVERDDPDDPRSGAAGAGSFSGDSGGLSFSWDQPRAQGFFRNSVFQTGRIYLFWSRTF